MKKNQKDLFTLILFLGLVIGKISWGDALWSESNVESLASFEKAAPFDSFGGSESEFAFGESPMPGEGAEDEGTKNPDFAWSPKDFKQTTINLPMSGPEPARYNSIPMNELIPELDSSAHRQAGINAKSFERIFLWEEKIFDSQLKNDPSMDFGWSIKPEARKRARRFGNGY